MTETMLEKAARAVCAEDRDWTTGQAASVAIVLLSIAAAGNVAVAFYGILSGVYWTIPINVAMIALCLVCLCLAALVRRRGIE